MTRRHVLISLETARRLRREGHDVPLVVLLGDLVARSGVDHDQQVLGVKTSPSGLR
ncbi:hypothetical protein [Planomonospora sp. ID82291]|uniref:hypothetical protein n=1 Tax=Planomonospora sp. ID82291 TaxID=2738136 RepID=UPI0018C4381C|nr:hypothetical protein [Planomonospora sp. ID82291]MBG0816417.1 hypothetical protein [Planomonospora sp. ID82291]